MGFYMEEARKNRSIRAGLDGFFVGCVLYAFPIVTLHVYLQFVSFADAIMLFVVTGIFYGVVLGSVAGTCDFILTYLFRSGDYRRNLATGLFLVQWPLWVVVLIYDLAYEQIPFLRPSGPMGLALWIGALIIVVGLVAAGFSWYLARVMVTLKTYSGRTVTALTCVVVVAAVTAAAAIAPQADCLSPNPQLTKDAGDGVTGNPDPADKLRVFWLGIDGADWRVMNKLIDKGVLPAFAQIKRQGAAGALKTIPDANSAVIWASKYTGLAAECHGIQDFYRIKTVGMSEGFYPVHRTLLIEIAGWMEKVGLARRLISNRNDLSSPTIWEIIHAHGLSTGLISPYLYSYPFGVDLDARSWSVAYGASYEAQRGGARLRKFLLPESLIESKETLLLPDFLWQSELLLTLIDDRPVPDFVHVYSHEPDNTSHAFWHEYEPELYFGAKPVRSSTDKVSEMYRRIDSFVGKLIERLPQDTVLIISSDHGQAATVLSTRTSSVHRFGPPGVLLLYGGPVRAGAALSDVEVLDVFPTILYLLGNAIPTNSAGQILYESFDSDFVARKPSFFIDISGAEPAKEKGEDSIDQEFNEEQLKALKALGYIGE